MQRLICLLVYVLVGNGLAKGNSYFKKPNYEIIIITADSGRFLMLVKFDVKIDTFHDFYFKDVFDSILLIKSRSHSFSIMQSSQTFVDYVKINYKIKDSKLICYSIDFHRYIGMKEHVLFRHRVKRFRINRHVEKYNNSIFNYDDYLFQL